MEGITMYLDVILFYLGVGVLAVAVFLAIWLIVKRKRSRELKRILFEETQSVDVLETLKSTLSGSERFETNITVAQTDDAVTRPETGYNTMGLISPETRSDSTAPALDIYGDLDISVLNGKYELLREIHGGGMSRVFLGRNLKVGNDWIIKYVDGRYAALANEADVLKKLNNINLPQIIDIFQTGQGTFLVERFIEGYSLSEVIKLSEQISESMIIEWGIQLSQVLRYLHNLETPIIHCDLKPSNIMVTYDNRLVLIDFGISKTVGMDGGVQGLTLMYAAPEQFTMKKGRETVIRSRFGELPEESKNWKIDKRTDIYSTGVILFELVTGKTPTEKNIRDIYSLASRELADVVCRCIEIDPAKRFQSDEELMGALEEIRKRRMNIPRTLMLRRIATAACIVFALGGTASTASAAYIGQMENAAVVSMDPSNIVISVQQGVTLRIQKSGGFGADKLLAPGQLQWTYTVEGIARVDDDRLVGINVGETTLRGNYRGKDVEIHVTVTEPLNELTEISLRYVPGINANVYTGTGERDFIDGPLSKAAFVSPESMAASGDRLLVADSGTIRYVDSGGIVTEFVEPFYMTVDKVRSNGDTDYILTGPWEDVDGSYYGIAKLEDGTARLIYQTDAVWTVTTDFAAADDGTIWFIQQNLGMGVTLLCKIPEGTQESEIYMELPEGASNLALDGDGNIYISVPESGIIIWVPAGTDEWEYFAGVENERNFIDGSVANFYRPTSLVYKDDSLYVLDFDTVRRIRITDGVPEMTETCSGVPEAETNPTVSLGAGDVCVFPASLEAELAIGPDGRLLLSDPKNSCIYEIAVNK